MEVAVDVAGVPGGRSFTYHLPADLAGVGAGDAVLVEYGRRRAVGIVLARTESAGWPVRETKPVLAMIHAAGSLLPPLQARLADHLARHYLAPPAMVVRAMLPPGLLERVKQVVRSRHRDGGTDFPLSVQATLLLRAIQVAGAAGIALEDLPAEGGRASRARSLRELDGAGAIESAWQLTQPGARPRLERTIRLTDTGAKVARHLAAGRAVDQADAARRLGPRQRALLVELDGLRGDDPVPAAPLAARHGASAVTGLARRGMVDLASTVRERRPWEGAGAAARGVEARGSRPEGSSLTAEQANVVRRIEALVSSGSHAGILLEGPTASGKTAVYAAAIAAALRAGRGAIVLVPEIALAVPLLDRLRHELGVEPALLHSGLSEGERSDEWRRVRTGEAPVVIGTRSAILAPMATLGVVIVDEEHDAAYKSDRTPRYQARDAALELGRLAGAPVVLGSATPDIASVGRARLGRLEHHRLPDRPTGAGVRTEVVDLRAELASGNTGLLSRVLVDALASLDRSSGERAILVIDRRGSASVVLCRDCGYVQICPECQRPLVFHATQMALRCHHCGATAPVARRCPSCASPRIRYLGGGTQRVEREVAVRLPHLRVARLDRDVVERRGAAVSVVDAFTDGRVDVLVGTRVVAKGLDVPQVTLVGVVSADIALNLPDERAAERTYQLLVQAVGRAGRGGLPGRAIIQTYQPAHAAIRAVADGRTDAFVEEELRVRRAFGSPPFGTVIKATIAMEDRAAAIQTAERFANELRTRAATLAPEGAPAVAVLGPAPAYIARRGGRWRFHLILRGKDPAAVLGGDPGAPWSIDVDPDSLL